jgi:hypothetical protein
MITPYVASLRVYEPIDSFTDVDRQRWESLEPDSDTGRKEQLGSLQRLMNFNGKAHWADGAHIIIERGSRYIAPWSTTQRCWVALNDFKNSLPSSVASMFFSSEEELTEMHTYFSNSTGYSHILTETWIIPPRWFALFSPEERRRGNVNEIPFTIMRTEMSLARQRCLATHRVVREAFGLGPVEQELGEMMKWLQVFDAHSIVECDYGGLAIYLKRALQDDLPRGLEADTSIEDVQSSIEGLIKGDGAQASQSYERLVSRWRRVAAFEQAM